MGNKLLIIAGLAILASKALAGDTIRSRSFASCGYVGGQIYCFGGDTSASLTSDMTIDTTIYSLNIVQFSGQTTDSMSNKWETVVPKTPFNTEPRRTPSSIVLPDGKRFLIQGGHNMAYAKLTNQTIVFDTTTQSWEPAMAFSEGNRGTRQIYFSTAVNLPNNLVGFYGGYEQLANTAVPWVAASGETILYDVNNGTLVGFNVLQMYTPGATNWAPFNPQINAPANYYPNSQTATIDTTSGKVYYFGGSYYTPSTYRTVGDIRAAFSWAYTFDTKSGAWVNETFSGEIPSDRLYHSTNLLPNSRDIILYGGTNDGNKATLDYCYTVNLLNNTWTKQSNVNVPSYLSGPRFTHSSVLVNSTLFIIFGRGLDGALNPSMLTIDVANVANVSYASIFNAASDSVVPPPSNNSTDGATGNKSHQSAGLSKGAIGGIAAGCAVGGIALIGFLVFCLRRQKKQKQQRDNNAEEYSNEPIHVDWDKIDDQYREMPPALSSAAYSPHSANSTAAEAATIVNSPHNTFASTTPRQQYTPNLLDSNLIDDNSKISLDQRAFNTQSPNTLIDERAVKPSIVSDDKGYTIVKPDGN